MSRRLIVNADDYGLSPAVSAGILKAARGLVTSTTVLANLVTPLELTFLAQSGLAAGAHLNISLGAPLSADYPPELLTELGGFSKSPALEADSWDDDLRRRAVRREWQAQIDKLLASGIELDHLDSHHHVHLLEPLFPLAVELAREHGLGLRVRAEQTGGARGAGVRTPDCLVEGFFGKDNIGRQSLLAELDNAPGDTVEVMCHPGEVDGLLRLRSGYTTERELELATLCETRLKVEVENRAWILGGYQLIK
jgi:predicted glycoside hydrolase/deacetylase ChbG (UPF0249 family)